MLCSACSKSFDSASRYCSCCGQPLCVQAAYPEGPLMRVREGRMIAGVCAGFAHAYRLDVPITRLVVAVLALFSGGTVVVAYILAWIIMPQAPFAVVVPPADIVTS